MHQAVIFALVALLSVQIAQVNAWNSGRATFYGKDGW